MYVNHQYMKIKRIYMALSQGCIRKFLNCFIKQKRYFMKLTVN